MIPSNAPRKVHNRTKYAPWKVQLTTKIAPSKVHKLPKTHEIVVKDDIEFATPGTIPLWAFGLMY